MKKNTINNQEMSKEMHGYCTDCGVLSIVENVYKLQQCLNCGKKKVLPSNTNELIKVTSIEKVATANCLDVMYDFQMYFGFENDEEVNEFIDSECYPHHFIYCAVNFENGVFDLENAKYGIDEEAYNFSEQQLLTIRDNVIEYIIDNNLGEIKNLDKIILEKVCEYYGCGLNISDDSVILEDFIDAELETVSDALILFYEDFLKDDWCNKTELRYIENLIEEKAFKVVKEWLDIYSYKVVSRKKDNGVVTLLVEDLDSVSNENYIIENTLNYWCDDFINEIYSKNVDEEVREEWIEKDVKPMQSYLNMRSCINKDSKYLALHSNSSNNNSNKITIVDSFKLESNLEVNLSLEIKDKLYIIHSDFPIVTINEKANVEFINKFYFSRNTGSFKLVYCENVDGNKINKRKISMFANMDSGKFIGSCVELCERNVSSYVEYNNQKYQVNNIIDFLKLESLKDVSLDDIKLSFDTNEQFAGFVLKHLSDCSEGKFGDILYTIKDRIIFDKNMTVVARKYAEQVLGLNATQLKYMDYLSYFIEEVSYEEVDDYIVVYL